MTAFKDVYDIIEGLRKKTKDKQILYATFPIEKKLLEAERESLRIERDHVAYISELNDKYSKTISGLEQQISELKDRISKYENKSIAPIGVLKEH